MTLVADAVAAAELADLARQRPLSCVGIDFESRGVVVGRRNGKDDL